MVQRFVSYTTGKYGPCYASYINESIAANPTYVMAHIDQEEVSDQTATCNNTQSKRVNDD